MADVRSSGTVKVFLRQWERPGSPGTGVERGQASTWTCALGKPEAQYKQREPDSVPGALATQENSLGEKWLAPRPRWAAITLGDCGSGRRKPIVTKGRYFCKCYT